MTIQTLVAALNQDIATLPDRMHLDTDAIIINQCNVDSDENREYQGHNLRLCCMNERGVGNSRNAALDRATADIILYSDEDIVYDEGYGDRILQAFESYPDADMLLFNVEVIPERRTYYTTEAHRVRWYNCGRYPAYSFAIKRQAVIDRNIRYSLLFGGGAKYSNGEDSLYIQECIRKGMRVYALPIAIGHEEPRPSTWFTGYNDKFFFDRGVLYHYMYGPMAIPFGIRFLYRQPAEAYENISKKQALSLIKQGIREGKKS